MEKASFTTVLLIDLGLLLLSIFFYIMASDYPPMARTFPSLVLMMVGIVAILDMINIIRMKKGKKSSGVKGDETEGVHPGREIKVLYTVVLMFVFYLFMVLFGLIVGTLLFLLLSGWTLGYRKWKYLILSSVIITVFVYVIFQVIMNSLLPEGLIFKVIGG